MKPYKYIIADTSGNITEGEWHPGYCECGEMAFSYCGSDGVPKCLECVGKYVRQGEN